MRAMRLMTIGEPLVPTDLEVPEPAAGEVRVRVRACAVCRTDLHIVDGELAAPALPRTPGHEVVGVVDACGDGVHALAPGTRVGIPWLGSTCGHCPACSRGEENLCDTPEFTGYTRDGGYAEYAVARADYCFPLPDAYDDTSAAPLLCAGLIGYRTLRMAGDAEHVGLYGFGAAAHIVAQVARWQGRRVYAFTRPGDDEAQRFARDLGATWAGASDEPPPRLLDAALLFAPVGSLVPTALAAVRKGGRVVCGGIHMSDIPSFPYALLWQERSVRSVANLTRDDAHELLALAPRIPIHTETETFPLTDANEALRHLREGHLRGAAVLLCDPAPSDPSQP